MKLVYLEIIVLGLLWAIKKRWQDYDTLHALNIICMLGTGWQLFHFIYKLHCSISCSSFLQVYCACSYLFCEVAYPGPFSWDKRMIQSLPHPPHQKGGGVVWFMQFKVLTWDNIHFICLFDVAFIVLFLLFLLSFFLILFLFNSIWLSFSTV